MSALTEMIVTIATAIVGLAIISVLVSRNSNTAGVIQAGASGFNNALGVAEAPVTGAAYTPYLGYPASGGLAAYGSGGAGVSMGFGGGF